MASYVQTFEVESAMTRIERVDRIGGVLGEIGHGLTVLNVEPGGYCPIMALFSNGLAGSMAIMCWFFPRIRPIIERGS